MTIARKKRFPPLRNSGSEMQTVAMRLDDLKAIGEQIKKLRAVVARRHMTADSSVRCSVIAREIELLLRAYLEPRIPGIDDVEEVG